MAAPSPDPCDVLAIDLQEMPPSAPGGPQSDTLLVSVEEAARLLTIDRSTVYAMLGRGELPSIKIGRRRLVSRQALHNFITLNETKGP